MENLKINNICSTKLPAKPVFSFCCSLIFRWWTVWLFQVEPRQGEKPYAYEVKRPQATALTRASHPQSFFSVRPAQTKPVRNMAPLASHITVSPYQDIPPPHMTPVTPPPQKPRAPFHPDRWQTAAMLAPCQPAALPTASPARSVTLVYGMPGSATSHTRAPALPIHPCSVDACPASLPRPRSTSCRPVGIMEEAASRTVDSPAGGRPPPLLPPNAGSPWHWDITRPTKAYLVP